MTNFLLFCIWCALVAVWFALLAINGSIRQLQRRFRIVSAQHKALPTRETQEKP